MTSRKQISMVLPTELIAAIKSRAAQRGLTMTAYLTELVRADLGEPPGPDPRALAEQMVALQQRIDRLEQQAPPA